MQKNGKRYTTMEESSRAKSLGYSAGETPCPSGLDSIQSGVRSRCCSIPFDRSFRQIFHSIPSIIPVTGVDDHQKPDMPPAVNGLNDEVKLFLSMNAKVVFNLGQFCEYLLVAHLCQAPDVPSGLPARLPIMSSSVTPNPGINRKNINSFFWRTGARLRNRAYAEPQKNWERIKSVAFFLSISTHVFFFFFFFSFTFLAFVLVLGGHRFLMLLLFLCGRLPTFACPLGFVSETAYRKAQRDMKS